MQITVYNGILYKSIQTHNLNFIVYLALKCHQLKVYLYFFAVGKIHISL